MPNKDECFRAVSCKYGNYCRILGKVSVQNEGLCDSTDLNQIPLFATGYNKTYIPRSRHFIFAFYLKIIRLKVLIYVFRFNYTDKSSVNK